MPSNYEINGVDNPALEAGETSFSNDSDTQPNDDIVKSKDKDEIQKHEVINILIRNNIM